LNLALWHALVGLIGGLALFLYGIEKLSNSLRSAAGTGLNALLAKLTANRFAGVATGIVVTGIVQSSSLTTVLVVGFVSAGLMTLRQSIGIIMGANIGTTLTIHLVAFKVTDSAWLLIALGFAASALSRREALKHLGAVLLGLGFLFLSLNQMTAATSPLREYPIFAQLMKGIEQPVLGVLVGASFTAIVQSSAATSGLVIALATQGAIVLPAGLALMLGGNLGSCATAMLAGWGRPSAARQAALVHVLFNAFGVLAWIGFLPQLAWSVESLSNDLSRQIANAHTLFNLANTLVLIWLVGPLARFAEWWIPAEKVVVKPLAEPKYLDATLLGTPSLALERAKLELSHLGELVEAMLERAPKAVFTGSSAELRKTADMDQSVDELYLAIVEYCRALARSELTAVETGKLEVIISAANYLESVADIVATNLVTQGMQRFEQQVQISPATHVQLNKLFEVASSALHDGLQSLLDDNVVLALEVVDRKEQFNGLMDSAYGRIRQRLLSSDPHRLPTFQVEVDLVHLVQRIFYFARRTARLVLRDSDA